jgi:DNA-binding PadR family transcriptional regulator
MIDHAILGLLKEQELHGYGLKKRLSELLGARSRGAGGVSFGSLYPALARLERTGAVKAVEHNTAADPTPMAGSLTGELAAFKARHLAGALTGRGKGGRGKKVYGITERGEARLVELLTEPDVADDRCFALKVAFCRHLQPAERLALFERKRAELIRRRDERPQRAARDTYRRSLWEHDDQTTINDLAWVERLISTETSVEGAAQAPDKEHTS